MTNIVLATASSPVITQLEFQVNDRFIAKFMKTILNILCIFLQFSNITPS